MAINLDRMTNDPSYEHYAYRPRPPRRQAPTIIIPLWAVILCAVMLGIALSH